MPSRDSNGNFVYSKAEYDHLNFTAEIFSVFVEGIGYTCTEVMVTDRPINKSGTHYMFDINLIGYTFDMSDMAYNSEPTLSDTQSRQNSNTPDRSDYATLPRGRKFEYTDDWYNPINFATFIDNVAIDLVNPIIDMLNGAAVSSQIGLNEGFDAWWEYEKSVTQKTLNAPIDFVTNHYNYMINTSVSQQLSDFGRDLSNPHNLESGVALGIGMYVGARSSGMMPKAKLPKTNIGIRALTDVGYKTLYNSYLQKYGFDLSKKYFNGFQIYNKSAPKYFYIRVQAHRHAIPTITKNTNRYPHINIDIPKLGNINYHIILDRNYKKAP